MHRALGPPGRARDALVLEPGCGTGNFMNAAPQGMRFIGVEMDGISGRIARALHPEHDIRIENFRDTKLPEGSIDAVIGNPPFADVRLDYHGQKLPLHDFFIAKSLDAVKPGGILAVVTSHYTLDKQNAAAREHLAEQADFLGAIRLPSDAFKREGTRVVTDIVFLRKRAPASRPTTPIPTGSAPGRSPIDGAEVTVNRYFLNHPEMVLGTWSRKDTLYGGEAATASPATATWPQQLDAGHPAAARMHASPAARPERPGTPAPASFTPPPPERHIAEGSFFIGDDKVIRQVEGGQGVPVVYGGTPLKAGGTMTGKRLAP